MIPLNQRRAILAKIANRLSGPFAGWRYEIDELINEAWLCPKVRAAQEPWQLFTAGRWAMHEYRRTQSRTRVKTRVLTESAISGGTYIADRPIVVLDNVEFRDYFEHASYHLTREQLLAVKLRLAGFEWAMIARIIGVYSIEHAFQIHARACSVMRRLIGKALRLA